MSPLILKLQEMDSLLCDKCLVHKCIKIFSSG